MKIKIYPSELKGIINIPPSKSLTHRALICASLCKGISIINNPLYSDDTNNTISVLRALGVEIQVEETKIIVISNGVLIPKEDLIIYESASTLRFMIPIISLFNNEFRIYSSAKLLERINTKDLNSLSGLKFSITNNYVDVMGKLESNLILSEDITSQWISGILFTLPFTNAILNVIDYKNDYITLTIEMMKEFKAIVDYHDGKFISKNFFQASEVSIEGDLSNASFFLNMSVFNNLFIKNYNLESIQGDIRYLSFLNEMNYFPIMERSSLSIKNNITKSCTIDLFLNPDLAIPLACLASVSEGIVKLTGLSKLKYKESDRIYATFDVLSKLGADISIDNDCLIINGKSKLKGGVEVDSFNDHRIVMGLSSIASKIDLPFVINNYEAVNKSFPHFFEVFKSIGGKYDIEL